MDLKLTKGQSQSYSKYQKKLQTTCPKSIGQEVDILFCKRQKNQKVEDLFSQYDLSRELEKLRVLKRFDGVFV